MNTTHLKFLRQIFEEIFLKLAFTNKLHKLAKNFEKYI